jgi:hypothetical protein
MGTFGCGIDSSRLPPCKHTSAPRGFTPKLGPAWDEHAQLRGGSRSGTEKLQRPRPPRRATTAAVETRPADTPHSYSCGQRHLYFPMSRAIAAGYMVQEKGLLVGAPHPAVGGGGMPMVWNLYSM